MFKLFNRLNNKQYKFKKISVFFDGCCRKDKKTLLRPYDVHYRNFKKNRGRGFIRKQAVIDCNSELLLFLDSTNVLPKNFAASLEITLTMQLVCAASGVINNHESACGISTRWRSRHLFKSEMTYNNFHDAESLTTYGTILRRAAVLDVGNFDPTLRHSEDKDLGKRLLNNGYKIIGDPNLVVYSIKKTPSYPYLKDTGGGMGRR